MSEPATKSELIFDYSPNRDARLFIPIEWLPNGRTVYYHDAYITDWLNNNSLLYWDKIGNKYIKACDYGQFDAKFIEIKKHSYKLCWDYNKEIERDKNIHRVNIMIENNEIDSELLKNLNTNKFSKFIKNLLTKTHQKALQLHLDRIIQ